MLSHKRKPIDPIESINDAMLFIVMLEPVVDFDIEKLAEDKELIYRLSIHYQTETVHITIPALTAYQKPSYELLELIMHTLGWRKEDV
jgi:hypothetical protein